MSRFVVQRRVGHVALGALLTLLIAGSSSAVVRQANWLADNGSWEDGSLWSTSPFFPHNGNGGDDYNVSIHAGTPTVHGDKQVLGLQLSGGSLAIPSPLDGVHVIGQFDWQQGAVFGPGRIEAAERISIGGTNTKAAIAATISNAGLATWTGGSQVGLVAGSTFNNLAGARLELQADGTAFGGANGGLISNAGTLTKTAGTGLTFVDTRVNNLATGTIVSAGGTLFLLQPVNNVSPDNKTLTGGKWAATGGGQLAIAHAAVENLVNVGVLLDGTGSAFTCLNGTLANIDEDSRLMLSHGASLNTADNLRIDGQLVAGPGLGSTLTSAGSVTIGDTARLSGEGELTIGTLSFASTGEIVAGAGGQLRIEAPISAEITGNMTAVGNDAVLQINTPQLVLQGGVNALQGGQVQILAATGDLNLLGSMLFCSDADSMLAITILSGGLNLVGQPIFKGIFTIFASGDVLIDEGSCFAFDVAIRPPGAASLIADTLVNQGKFNITASEADIDLKVDFDNRPGATATLADVKVSFEVDEKFENAGELKVNNSTLDIVLTEPCIPFNNIGSTLVFNSIVRAGTTLSNSGEFTATGGSLVTFTPSEPSANAGSIRVAMGASVVFTGPVSSTGRMEVDNGFIGFMEDLRSGGANDLDFNPGAEVEVGGELELGGATTATLSAATVQVGGSVTVAPGALLVLEQGAKLHADGGMDVAGKLDLDDPALLVVLVTPRVIVRGEGEISGSGSIQGNVQNGGAVSPGKSPGVVAINGDYQQLTSGTLVIDINGPTPRTEHDVLQVTGTAEISGTLQVRLRNSVGEFFFPDPATPFEFLTASGGIRGQFDQVISGTSGLGGQFDLTHDQGRLLLHVVDTFLIGDYNASGLVEQGDLDLVLLNWGQGPEVIPAGWVSQRPLDGIVDQLELDNVLLSWGNSGRHFGVAPVPEPRSLVLGLLLFVFGVGIWSRRTPTE